MTRDPARRRRQTSVLGPWEPLSDGRSRPFWIGAVVPFTLIGIMPMNKTLLTPGRDLGRPETRSLLEHWAKRFDPDEAVAWS